LRYATRAGQNAMANQMMARTIPRILHIPHLRCELGGIALRFSGACSASA
jgi:hypothetical protein